MKFISSGFSSLPKSKIIFNTINNLHVQIECWPISEKICITEEFTDGRLSVLAVEFYKSFLIIIRVKKPCSHLCFITVNLSIHHTFFP